MHPILIQVASISIYTYGFFVALGFLVAIMLAKYEAKKVGINQNKIMDLCFYIILAAILGSRLFYILTNLTFFIKNPIDIFKIWNGGLVFYGGFLCAFVVGIIYLIKEKLPFWKTVDIFAPSLAIGHFFGRIGCFFAGCCYGKVCDLPWAITFTNQKSLAPINVHLHPTQLYSAANNLIIFLFLILIKRYKKIDGQLFLIYIFLYGITRSIIEIFRGDYRGGIFLNTFSVSQTIGISMAIISVIMLIILSKYHKKSK